MSLDKKIISEIQRYQKINRYILEQAGDIPVEPGLEALTPPAGATPPPAPAGAVPPPAPEAPTEPQPIDVESDPEVEKIDDKGKSEEGEEGGSEELDITELVDSQKNIETKQE
jgi:hypothetical protein